MIEINKKLKRNKEILKLKSSGLSNSRIGEKFGITREAVRLIVLNNGVIKFRGVSKLESYLREVKQTTGRSRAREMVRLRDNHTCQDCGFKLTTKFVLEYNSKIIGLKGKIKSLDVHHLEGQCGKNSVGYDSPKDISGMVTLCHRCHFNRPEHRTKSSSFSLNLTS